MAEDLYEEFIRELLNIRDDNVHMICDSREFFRVLGGKKDSRQAWKKQYYYRCLTVILARVFIHALEHGKNYVEAVDVYDVFPHYNFHVTFRLLCEVLGGNYKRGKCYTALKAEDYRQFIKIRDNTKTAEELMARWKQYLAGAGRLRVGGPEASQ